MTIHKVQATPMMMMPYEVQSEVIWSDNHLIWFDLIWWFHNLKGHQIPFKIPLLLVHFLERQQKCSFGHIWFIRSFFTKKLTQSSFQGNIIIIIIFFIWSTKRFICILYNIILYNRKWDKTFSLILVAFRRTLKN